MKQLDKSIGAAVNRIKRVKAKEDFVGIYLKERLDQDELIDWVYALQVAKDLFFEDQDLIVNEFIERHDTTITQELT